MTFLEICQKVDTLLGSQGSISTVATSNGFQLLIIEYVKNAWLNIQVSQTEWEFYKTSVAFSTVENQVDYDLEDVFGAGVDNPVNSWDTDRFIREDYTTLTYVPYDRWIIEDHTNACDPSYFTYHPNLTTDGYLSFDKPDGVYNYTLHYFRIPQELSADADEPICPSQHHDAIVYQALADISGYLGNSELYTIASTRANTLYNNLLTSQNPAKDMVMRPLA